MQNEKQPPLKEQTRKVLEWFWFNPEMRDALVLRLFDYLAWPPHQILIFALVKLVDVKPAEVAEHAHSNLFELTTFFEERYQRSYEYGPDVTAWLVRGFRAQLERPLEELLFDPKERQTWLQLPEMQKRPAGTIALAAFLGDGDIRRQARRVPQSWNSMVRRLYHLVPLWMAFRRAVRSAAPPHAVVAATFLRPLFYRESVVLRALANVCLDAAASQLAVGAVERLGLSCEVVDDDMKPLRQRLMRPLDELMTLNEWLRFWHPLFGVVPASSEASATALYRRLSRKPIGTSTLADHLFSADRKTAVGELLLHRLAAWRFSTGILPTHPAPLPLAACA